MPSTTSSYNCPVGTNVGLIAGSIEPVSGSAGSICIISSTSLLPPPPQPATSNNEQPRIAMRLISNLPGDANRCDSSDGTTLPLLALLA